MAKIHRLGIQDDKYCMGKLFTDVCQCQIFCPVTHVQWFIVINIHTLIFVLLLHPRIPKLCRHKVSESTLQQFYCNAIQYRQRISLLTIPQNVRFDISSSLHKVH